MEEVQLSTNLWSRILKDRIDDLTFPPSFTFESGSSAMRLNHSGVENTGTKTQDKVVRDARINGYRQKKQSLLLIDSTPPIDKPKLGEGENEWIKTNVVCALSTALRATSNHKVIMVKMDNPLWQNRNTRWFKVSKPWMLTREGCQVISEAWGAEGEFVSTEENASLLEPATYAEVKEAVMSLDNDMLINGDTGRNFIAARGVRQGDPMFLYLFVLVMEMTIRYLKRQIMKGAIRLPYSVRAIPDVRCLMFADDLLLFSIASVKSITNIKMVLSQLEEIIGFIINNSKSSLFTFNVDTPLEQRLANIGRWQAVNLPLDYLGVPIFMGNLNVNLCAGLIAKFEKKLAPWKTQLLSYAGRACLITHNLSSMGNFWMQAFSLPNEVLKKLERCMARFLWIDTEVNRHIHQIACHTLCKPKAEGGIGLRFLEEVNVSLLATNWVRWKIGDGNSVFFWFNWWHDEILVKSISGEEYGVIVYQLKLFVAEVRSLGEAMLTLPSRALTASTCIQLANETDKLVSNATKLKDLSSRSIWDAIRQKGSQEGWRKRIWNNHIPPRASWTTYIASHMRLTTQDRLQRHGVHLANICHLCKREEENNVHVMFKCSVVQKEMLDVALSNRANDAFQSLQLKEDERKAMSTWLRTGILCEGRLSSLSMDTNVLQIVTYKNDITTMPRPPDYSLAVGLPPGESSSPKLPSLPVELQHQAPLVAAINPSNFSELSGKWSHFPGKPS
ncbi:reverse transcriptase-like protein [Nymphaea thermarum]|nr:reverse transcriptase-like protein [Nymphaea thermarum]